VCFSTLPVLAWDLQSQAIGGCCQQNAAYPIRLIWREKLVDGNGYGRFALIGIIEKVRLNYEFVQKDAAEK